MEQPEPDAHHVTGNGIQLTVSQPVAWRNARKNLWREVVWAPDKPWEQLRKIPAAHLLGCLTALEADPMTFDM